LTVAIDTSLLSYASRHQSYGIAVIFIDPVPSLDSWLLYIQ